MEKKTTPKPKDKFERVPRVTRSKAAAAVRVAESEHSETIEAAAVGEAASGSNVASRTPPSDATQCAVDEIPTEVYGGGSATVSEAAEPLPETNAVQTEVVKAEEDVTLDRSVDEELQSPPATREPAPSEDLHVQPQSTSTDTDTESDAGPDSLVTHVPVTAPTTLNLATLAAVQASGRGVHLPPSSGIQVTTSNLLDVAQQGGQQQAAGANMQQGPVKIEAVIDMAFPTPISAALEELLASQQCLNELEKAGGVDDSGDGLTQLLRAASATSATQGKETLASPGTGDMGLTLLAQAAAQEGKTGGAGHLPPISQLTSSGFTQLPENSHSTIYQQTAIIGLPEGHVDTSIAYTPATGAGVVSWPDHTTDLAQYGWFTNIAAAINPPHMQHQAPTDQLGMPASITMETLSHPQQMLMFDTSAAVQVGQPMDPHLSAMVAMSHRPAVTAEHVSCAYRPQQLHPVGEALLTGKIPDTPTAAQSDTPTTSRTKSRTPSSNGCVYQSPKCAYCDLRFDTRTVRDQHARECKSNPYRCPTCGKACLGTVKLQRHIRSHLRSRASSEGDEDRRPNNGPDPKCAYCNVRFPSRVARDRHSRMCEQNPYRCQLCRKAFLGTAKLTRHMRSHAEEAAAAAQAQGKKSPPTPITPNQSQGGDTAASLPQEQGVSLTQAPGANIVLAHTDSMAYDTDSSSQESGTSGCNDTPIDVSTTRAQAQGMGADAPHQISLLPVGTAMPGLAMQSQDPNGVHRNGGLAMHAISSSQQGDISNVITTVAQTQPVISANGEMQHVGPGNGQQLQQQCMQAPGQPAPQPVPMMVAMPLLSCW